MKKRIILFILLFLWMSLIFYFSSQPADESSHLSGKTLELIVNIFEKIFNHKFDDNELNYIYTIFFVPLRKLAHFSLYFILGIIGYFFNKTYFADKKAICLTLLFCLLYAISDEIHQIFVPGRAGQARDVLIDCSGSLMWLLFVILIKRIKKCNIFHTKKEV